MEMRRWEEEVVVDGLVQISIKRNLIHSAAINFIKFHCGFSFLFVSFEFGLLLLFLLVELCTFAFIFTFDNDCWKRRNNKNNVKWAGSMVGAGLEVSRFARVVGPPLTFVNH